MLATVKRLVLPLALGVALGLLYGWVIQPAEYVDVSPMILRADYRADYVLMIAEAHAAELDPRLAAQRLAVLGPEPPSTIVLSAIDQAREQAYSTQEMELLQRLLADMQLFQPDEQ